MEKSLKVLSKSGSHPPKDVIFKTIINITIVDLKKDTSESMFQFTKRYELYIKAIITTIDDETAIMLSVAYTNKLKYNVLYNSTIESLIQSLI